MVQYQSPGTGRADHEGSSAVTTLLEQAFTEAAKLPPQEQDALATWLIEELAAERRWSRLLETTPDILEQLAEEALAEHRADRTQPLDPERL